MKLAINRLTAAAILGACTSAGAAAQGVSAPGASAAHAHEHARVVPSRVLRFPDAGAGRRVLSVDLHTHSVFSDGHVWPTVRTWEAQKDGLSAIAVTEHLEYQPKRADNAARAPSPSGTILPGAATSPTGCWWSRKRSGSSSPRA
jgi:hypothetical protein